MGILIAYLLGILTASKPKDHHASHNADSSNTPQRQSPSNGPLSVLCTPPTKSEEESAEGKKRKRRETIKFRVELIGAFVLVIYTAFTILMWRANKKSADAAKSAADTAREQLELSERPWIKILDLQPRGDQPIVGGLSFQKIGPFKNDPDVRVQATIQIKLSFKNIGHSVADVTPNIEFFMPQFSASEYWNRVSAEEHRFCGSPDMSAVTEQKIVIFPDEPQPFDWYGGISTPIRRENINHLPEGTGIAPVMIVCVSYRHKGLPSIYQTRAVYEISRLGSETSRFFDIGECNLTPFHNSAPLTWCEGGVPAKLLRFARDYNGDDAY